MAVLTYLRLCGSPMTRAQCHWGTIRKQVWKTIQQHRVEKAEHLEKIKKIQVEVVKEIDVQVDYNRSMRERKAHNYSDTRKRANTIEAEPLELRKESQVEVVKEIPVQVANMNNRSMRKRKMENYSEIRKRAKTIKAASTDIKRTGFKRKLNITIGARIGMKLEHWIETQGRNRRQRLGIG